GAPAQGRICEDITNAEAIGIDHHRPGGTHRLRWPPGRGRQAVAQAAPVAAASPTPVTTSPTHVTSSPTHVTASPARVPSSPAQVTPPPTVLTAKLTPESGSKVAGTATVTTAGATFTIRLEATGLQPATTHPAQIRAGTCGSNGPIVFPLENMVTNGAG